MTPESNVPELRVFEFGEYQLDVSERLLIGPGGRRAQLTRRELDGLSFMLEHSGQLLCKEPLMSAVWKDAVVEENSLNQLVLALRKLLGERAGDARYIVTVPGSGYRFCAPVVVRTKKSGMDADARPSIAVLPFEDLSPSHDQTYLADGIAEELLFQFARVEGWRVIGKTSSFQLRGAAASDLASSRLGADYLLTGAIRRDGNRLRVSAQLADAANGFQRWSGRFDRELDDLFRVQDEIASAVVTALSAELGVGERAAGLRSTSSLQAYDVYLRARSIAQRSGRESMLRSAELYRAALEQDPSFAPAWAGLAESCRGLLVFAPDRSEAAHKELIAAAARAAALAPEAWTSWIAQYWRASVDYDWHAAAHAVRRAAALAPGTPPEVSFCVASFLADVGQTEASVEHFRLAARDDPLSLLRSAIFQKQLHIAGRENAADSEYTRSIDLPGNRDAAEHLALHRAWGRSDAAAIDHHFARYLQHQTVPLPVLTKVFAVRHEPHAAAALLMQAAGENAYQTATQLTMIAWWLAHYGETSGALDVLSRAYRDFGKPVASWLWLPVLAPVRRLPGFKDIVQRIGLVDYWRSTGNWGAFTRPRGATDFDCF